MSRLQTPITPYYYHSDQLGSVRSLTNSAGNVVNTYSYDAYGNTTSSSGTVYNPFKYAASYTDSESGLLYLRARYYDPSTQQFLTVDPLLAWTEQGYAYVSGSPTNGTDADGLAALPAGTSGCASLDNTSDEKCRFNPPIMAGVVVPGPVAGASAAIGAAPLSKQARSSLMLPLPYLA